MENKDNIMIAASLEEIINSLPNIISSKVILDNNNEVMEIHVLSDNNRNPKQISRDIQSAITASFGKSIDHKKISIAQINYKENINNEFRLKINSINYSIYGNIAEVKILLQKDEEIIEGNARGPNTLMNSYKLLASATLDCVHNLLNLENTFVIEDIEKIYIAKKDVIVVAISFINPSLGEELLVGSAVVRKDEKESVVKATLNAINRIIVKLDN